jgi:ferredoxin
MNSSTPLSATQINCLKCKLFFYWNYINSEASPPEVASTPLMRGRLIHEVIEKYLRHLEETKQETDWDWMHAAASQVNFGDAAEQAVITEMLCRFAHEDYHDAQHAIVEHPIAVKRTFGDYVNCDYQDKEAVFRGRFDRIIINGDKVIVVAFNGDEVIVEDFKSGYYMMPESAMEFDIQANMYAFLALVSMPRVELVTVRFRYARYGFAPRQRIFTQDDKMRIAAAVEGYKAQRDLCLQLHAQGKPLAEAWPAAACEHCDVCYYACPLKSAMIQRPVFPKPVNAMQAGQLADLLVVGEAAVKQLRGVLKEWCTGNGPAHGASASVGYKETAERHYPALKVLAQYEKLLAAGVDFSRLNVSGLSDELKIRKRDGKVHTKDTETTAALKAEILSGYATEISTEFGRIK